VRIVFVAWRDLAHPLAGGSEIVVDRLATGMMDRGHEVALLSGGPVGLRPYPVIDIGGTYGQYLRAPLAHRRFRDWDLLVDVSNGLPFFAPLWRRRPTLCLVHHVHTDQWALRFPSQIAAGLSAVERRVVPRIYRRNLFVAISDSTCAALAETGVDVADIRVVTTGVELPTNLVPKSPAPLFLVLTRLVPHKRVDLILAAWERVRPLTGGTLVIAGDGPERQRLEALAGRDVEFRGRISDTDKASLLGRAWMLVHGAHHEGWGLVIMEAAAAGTPAIAMDAPGVREAIDSGLTGQLAATEDDLADSWVALTADGPRRARFGLAARQRAARFGWDRTVENFSEVALEAVARQGVS
jgi:glycosyltransferase involved in cell wall biosynthesis